VVGAGGPMGMMHVIRNLCQGVEGVSVFAGDVDDNRLTTLSKVAEPVARQNGVAYRPYNARTGQIDEVFDYSAIMAPVPQLVAGAVKQAAPNGIVNIFAGIPANVTGEPAFPPTSPARSISTPISRNNSISWRRAVRRSTT